ncbi:MAG: hypothetical protein UV51_C0007G0006 [Candidatus Woesebacteria bacterium GW2011_GWC1_42_9]|nr:MAG: hypothetical protein UV51_C0007G0006 [Candidatus Woesebacteria bacterium GW2011_GWC1_42_9]
MEKTTSVNLTIHNKGFLLPRVMDAIKKNTVGQFEIVFVLDGCTDDSMPLVEQFCRDNSKIKTQILETPNVFETMANNVAAKKSNGDVIVIIQDDVIIDEYGYNKRMLKPIEAFSDVFMVTGRTAYNYVFNPETKHLGMVENLDNCWCDILKHEDMSEKGTGLSRDAFAIRNSINRGPLMIKLDVLESLNYLDATFSPLDQDDADLAHRAYKELGLLCGCYYINFISELAWGGTRPDGRNPAPWHFRAHHKNTKILYERHKDMMLTKHNENRTLI